MAQRDRRDISAALSAKGFDRDSDADHDYFDLMHDGKKIGIMTKLSRGSKYKTYDDSLLGRMTHQLHVNKKELLDLIDCPLSEDEYKNKLRGKGLM